MTLTLYLALFPSHEYSCLHMQYVWVGRSLQVFAPATSCTNNISLSEGVTISGVRCCNVQLERKPAASQYFTDQQVDNLYRPLNYISMCYI